MKYGDVSLGEGEAIINKLGGMSGDEAFLRGDKVLCDKKARIPSAVAVDLDADPFIPEGWELIEHERRGHVKWGECAWHLFVAENQRQDKYTVPGVELRRQLRIWDTANANLLDFLLRNPSRIPTGFGRGLNIGFWGTLYHNSDGLLTIRTLRRSANKWTEGYAFVGEWFSSSSPALILDR